VSRDSLDSHEKFKAKFGFPFELACDDGSLGDALGRDGRERCTFLIAGGDVKRAWRKVKVDGHVREVLSAIRTP
jgi:peroxiredoxin Q/BCP